MRLSILSRSIFFFFCFGNPGMALESSWRQGDIYKSIATSKPDEITFALSQYFPAMARFLATEEMTTPGDLTLVNLDATLAYYSWVSSKPCKSDDKRGKLLSKSGVTYIKNGEVWHISLISKDLSENQCSQRPIEEFVIKRLQLD